MINIIMNCRTIVLTTLHTTAALDDLERTFCCCETCEQQEPRRLFCREPQGGSYEASGTEVLVKGTTYRYLIEGLCNIMQYG